MRDSRVLNGPAANADAWRRLRLPVLFAVVFAACWLSDRYFRGPEAVAAIWPADGLVLAFMLRSSADLRLRALALGVSVAAMALANLVDGQGAALALGLPLANGAGIALAAWILRDQVAPMTGFKSYGRFLAAGVIAAPLLSGLLATGLVALAEPAANLPQMTFRWMTSDALGVAIFTPFALSIGGWRSYFSKGLHHTLMSVGAQVLVAAASVYVFMLSPAPFPVIILPLIMLAVFLNRDLGGALALVITAGISIVANALGLGMTRPVAGYLEVDPIFVIQLPIAMLVLTVHPVAAALKTLDRCMEELEGRRRAAEAQSSHKTKVLAHVSHEIRTPLSGVVTLAEMMKSGAMGELTPRQREVVARIADSGAEIEALSRDLMDAAAIQAGKAAARTQPVKVAAAIDEAVSAALFRTRDYRATIWAGEGFDPELEVAADPQRLRQILLNLIINGAKYGGKPAVVRVDAVEAGPGRVRFLVSDNGEGIAQDQRAGLFRAYDRLGAEGSGVDGSGLGLNLSRELAQLLGGDLGLADDNPVAGLGGACFWVELPRYERSAAAA